MKELQEMVFISEIVLQIKIAQRAAVRLQATNSGLDYVDVWSSIQLILIATANVSKILWPSNKYKSRGERLRERLKVEESNLLSDRKFRNHLEHYDERIQDWFSGSSSAVYSDLAMNPSMYTFGSVPSSYHRGYNSFINTFVFRGESLDLDSVLNALEEIRIRCGHYVLI